MNYLRKDVSTNPGLQRLEAESGELRIRYITTLFQLQLLGDKDILTITEKAVANKLDPHLEVKGKAFPNKS